MSAYLFTNKTGTIQQQRHAFPIVVFAVNRADALAGAQRWRGKGYSLQGEIDPSVFDNHGLSITTESYAAIIRENLRKLDEVTA